MSQGLGKIERGIAALFDNDSAAAVAVEELCEEIYRLRRGKAEKKHRFAVVRTGNTIIRRGANLDWYRWSAGRGSRLILYVPDSVRSYAKARLKSDPSEPWWQGETWLEAQLVRHRALMQPDGAWWRHVEIYKALRAGDEKRAKAIQAQIEEELQRNRGNQAELAQARRKAAVRQPSGNGGGAGRHESSGASNGVGAAAAGL